MNDRLIAARLAQGLTQRQAAAKMGISRETLRRLEAEEGTPFPGTRLIVAKFYGRGIPDLFDVGNTDDPAPTPA